MDEYHVRRCPATPELDGNWDNPVWQRAQTLTIDRFLSVTTERAQAQMRLLYDDQGIHGIFRSTERYVKCVHMDYQSNVFLDSCVEVFLRPKPDKGYVTFEMNCCGVYLTYHIADWTPKGDRFVDFTVIPWEVGQEAKVRGTFKGPIEEEIVDPLGLLTVPFFEDGGLGRDCGIEKCKRPLEGWSGVWVYVPHISHSYIRLGPGDGTWGTPEPSADDPCRRCKKTRVKTSGTMPDGKACASATCPEISDCVRRHSYWRGRPYNKMPWGDNCHDATDTILSDCCLK